VWSKARRPERVPLAGFRLGSVARHKSTAFNVFRCSTTTLLGLRDVDRAAIFLALCVDAVADP
jgi:hypothetical protein